MADSKKHHADHADASGAAMKKSKSETEDAPNLCVTSDLAFCFSLIFVQPAPPLLRHQLREGREGDLGLVPEGVRLDRQLRRWRRPLDRSRSSCTLFDLD